MFLASARDEVQVHEMAQIQTGFLEAETGAKPPTGQGGQGETAEAGMEGFGRLGMPAKAQRGAGRTRSYVFGGSLRSVELFTGAGGLALAIEKAGFHHDTVVERNRYCCQTIRENQARGFDLLDGWKLFAGDVRDFDYSTVKGDIDLLAGGPHANRSRSAASTKPTTISETCSRRWSGQFAN